MREIKFRVWHKYRKVMLEPMGMYWLRGREPRVQLRGDANMQPNNTVALMQFTGLKDKNDREIYEGDIVRCGNEQGQIQYDEDDAAFIILLHPNNDEVKSGAYNLGSTWPSPLKEVIGNIYENPDLTAWENK